MSYMPQTPTSNYNFAAHYSSYNNQSYDSYSSSYTPVGPGYGYGDYHVSQPKLTSPPPDALDVASIDEEAASKAVKRLVSAQLRSEGYVRAEPQALQELEVATVAFITHLYQLSHEYANLGNRSGPIPTDLLNACSAFGMNTTALHKTAIGRTKTKRKSPSHFPLPRPPTLLPPSSRPTTPPLLAPEEESTPILVPATIRTLPQPYPPLPPSHTYLRTPIAPPKKAALPSLEKKLKNASLVQGSLKNLLLATEDTTGKEDAELLGHVVNYEVTTHPRKKWKVGSANV